MKKINDALPQMNGTGDFQTRYNEMREEILSNDDINQFLQAHEGEITSKIIDTSLTKLYEYISQTTDCVGCPSLGKCVNLMQGYEPALVLQGNAIIVKYHPCKRKLIDETRKEEKELIQSFYVSKEILNASLTNFTQDSDGRTFAYKYAHNFSKEYVPGEKMKGLYLYGKFGVGKSYLLGALANQLAENKIASQLVYVPEFMQEMKQSIGDNSLARKLDVVKKAPILMLDDIGAELMTSWTRDEILGTILQYRMQENLPTFFTSNMDLAGLEHHLTYSQRGEEEELKAARIIERIKYLTVPLKVDGMNRRT